MDNIKKYNEAFKDCLYIDDSMLNELLVYRGISTWDSVGHMNLIANLEETFDILLNPADIMGFSSYDKGKEILAKYDIVI